MQRQGSEIIQSEEQKEKEWKKVKIAKNTYGTASSGLIYTL